MPIVLTEEFGEKPMVVEMEFERIFRDYLRNCCFDPLATLTAVDPFSPPSHYSYSSAFRPRS